MKRLVIFFFLCSFDAFGQSDSLLETCRLCDTIQFAGNLLPFYEKLDASNREPGASTVKVIQIGDSHVQMGHFPTGIEAELRKVYPAFVNTSFRFPYVLTGGYTPPSYRIDTTGNWRGEKMVGPATETHFALSGHAVVLTGSRKTEGALEFTLAEGITGIEMLIETNRNWKISADSTRVTVTPAGNNLAIVKLEFIDKREHFRIVFRSRKKSPQPLRVFGFRQTPAERGLQFESYGSSGGKYSDYASKCTYCPMQLAYARPDLLIVSLGTNDAFGTYEGQTYYELVSGFIRKVRSENPQAAILLTTQPDTYYKAQKPASDLIVLTALLRIAQENDCALWDLASVMGGCDSIHWWRAEGLAGTDMLHFTQEGYTFQAQLLVDALNKGFEAYRNGSLK
jgi:lysophospholipase L1-like esterase